MGEGKEGSKGGRDARRQGGKQSLNISERKVLNLVSLPFTPLCLPSNQDLKGKK